MTPDNKLSLRPILALSQVRSMEGRCVEVAAGGMHSLARFESGHVYAWGMSTFGQLGRGSRVVGARSAATPGLVILKPDPPALRSSSSSPPSSSPLPSSSSLPHPGDSTGVPLVAVQISCGGMHSAAISEQGCLYCWGRADSGQLGIGRHWMTDRAAFVAVGNFTYEGSTVAQWNNKKLRAAPLSLSNCCICWPALVPRFSVASLTAAIPDSGASRRKGCRDAFDYEQTAQGTKCFHDRTVVRVSCGAFHTACITASGRLFSWGKEEYGCLGIHFTGSRLTCGVYTPQEVELPPLPRSRSSTMGQRSNGEESLGGGSGGVKMQPGGGGGGVKVKHVVCGGAHTLAIDEYGRVLACGKNEAGQLGLGDLVNRITFEAVPYFDESRLWPQQRACDVESSRKEKVAMESKGANQGFAKVIDVAAGGAHSVFMTSDGRCFACGRITLGRIGVADGVLQQHIRAGRGAQDSVALPTLVQGSLSESRQNRQGRRYRTIAERYEPIEGTVGAISAGGQHSCVILCTKAKTTGATGEVL
jgi:alpha-tubulin suppressor-like RCC1 family protein